MQFNTRRFTVAPLPKMHVKVQSVHQHWMANPNITARDLHRLLGMLVFMAPAGPARTAPSSSSPMVGRHSMVPEDRELVRRLRWFPSICQECATSRRIPCPESARHWPRSGRWPWRIYDPCLPSGANHRSICLRHSPTDDSSSSYRHIRTPGWSGQMPCPCAGTRKGASCTPSRHSRWSRKFCRRSLNHQECRWYWSLNCNRQHHGSQSWWTYPKTRFRCS